MSRKNKGSNETPMRYALFGTPLAWRQLGSIASTNLRRFVRRKIEQLASEPRPSTSTGISKKDFHSFLLDVPPQLRDLDLAEEDDLRRLYISKGNRRATVGYIVRPSQLNVIVCWILTDKTYGKAIEEALMDIVRREQAGRRDL